MLENFGKNGRLVEHIYWKGNGRLSLKLMGNRQRLNRPSLWLSRGAKVLEIVAQKAKRPNIPCR